MKKVLLLLMALFVGSGFMSAEESVAYTLKFDSSYNNDPISSYTKTWTATVDGFTWNIENFNNNNNNDWAYVRCGSKNFESIAKITTSSAIKETISKVVITIDDITVGSVNSIQLKTSSNPDFTTLIDSVGCTPAEGAITFAITQPQANLYYQLVFDCKKGSKNGIIQLSKVEYYSNETVVSRAATHVSFSPNGGELAESKDVTMKALDADNNEVDNATIYYKVGNGDELNGKSPLTITLDAPATVEAWVADQETHNSATFTFPVVQPSAPVFKVDDDVLSGEEVELPYGTVITISAENATSLDVNVNDEVTTVERNYTTIVLTADVTVIVTAKNGDKTEESIIDFVVATPELTVKVGEETATDGGTYTIEQGTAIKVTATDAQSITILDKDANEVALQNNCFYPMEDNEYMIEASAGEKSVLITIKVTVTAAEYIDMTATYDFTTEGAYGLTTYSGTDGDYEQNVKDINVNDVNLHFNQGNYRLWSSSSGYELRLYKGVSFTISVPSNCYITKIATGVTGLTADPAGTSENGPFTYNDLSDVKAVTFTATSSPKIKTITVSYTKYNYSAEGSISFGDAYSYDEYSKANVLTFKPTIKFNGASIEDGYGEYTVLLNGVELGQADQAISHFAPVDSADNKFQLRKGTKVIDVDVTWPAINAKPAIKGVRYVQNNDSTLDVIYTLAPEDETPGYSWLVNVSNEGAELGWTENAATCTFKNVGAEAVNAPANINAALAIPFAVKSTDGTAALAEGDEVYDVVEYSAPVVELSTDEVAKPNDSNTSGVADVAVDQNSAVEYYNLQGVRVNGDLTPGLYIRRQGNQATKVVVR